VDTRPTASYTEIRSLILADERDVTVTELNIPMLYRLNRFFPVTMDGCGFRS
jgi:hypothetical protein